MRTRTGALPRLLALGLCAASVAGIVWIARGGASDPALATPGADCVASKRAQIEAEKAAGMLTAEQAMMRRQKINAECG